MATTVNISNVVAGTTSIALANANTYDFINLVVKKANAVVLTKRKDSSTTQNIVVDADSVDVALTAGEVALLESTNYELYAYAEEDKRPVLRLVGTITKSASTPEPAGEVGRSNLYKYTGLTLPVVDSESDFTEVGDIVYHNGSVKVRTSTAFTGVGGSGKPIELHKANGEVIGYENGVSASHGHTLSEVSFTAVSGDLIKVKRGVYNVIDSYVKLNDGVDWDFEVGVDVNCNALEGTFTDDGDAAVCSLRGFPKITNTNGLDKRIVLTNANSRVNDFWWEYEGQFKNEEGTLTLEKTIKNTYSSTSIISFGTEVSIDLGSIPPTPNKSTLIASGTEDTAPVWAWMDSGIHVKSSSPIYGAFVNLRVYP